MKIKIAQQDTRIGTATEEQNRVRNRLKRTGDSWSTGVGVNRAFCRAIWRYQ